jgi:hypothetical protein
LAAHKEGGGRKMKLINYTDEAHDNTFYQKCPKGYLGEEYFLCHHDHKWFTSVIYLNRNNDKSMPSNCADGCLYVDDIAGKAAIPIHFLRELYLIKE